MQKVTFDFGLFLLQLVERLNCDFLNLHDWYFFDGFLLLRLVDLWYRLRNFSLSLNNRLGFFLILDNRF